MAALAEVLDVEGHFRLMGFLQEHFPDDMEEGVKKLGAEKVKKIMRGETITETDFIDGV